MSFTERLAKALEQAPARTVYNAQQKQYNWQAEASQKRSIR